MNEEIKKIAETLKGIEKTIDFLVGFIPNRPDRFFRYKSISTEKIKYIDSAVSIENPEYIEWLKINDMNANTAKRFDNWLFSWGVDKGQENE